MGRLSTPTGPVCLVNRSAGVVRGFAAAVVFASALVLGPVVPAAAGPVESIASYDTTIEVHKDGLVRVSETIGYDFGGNSRHGIIRRIPTRLRYDDTRDRVYPVDSVTVTMDGRAVPVARGSDGNDDVLKIGDPNRTVTGTHTFVIGYTVRGALTAIADHVELYWNVVGDEWTVPIASATATVTGPTTLIRSACYTGPAGSRQPCASTSTHGMSATFGQSDLSAGAGMAAVVAFPPDAVRGVAPLLVDRHDFGTAFRATRETVGSAVGLGLLGVIVALLVARRSRRDRRYGGQPSTSAPPDGVRPGHVGALIEGRIDVVDIAATIVDFAVRGHLRITELPRINQSSVQDWRLVKVTDGDPSFSPYERRLFDALFRGRRQATVSMLKYTIPADVTLAKKDLDQEMVTQGWYRSSPAGTRAAVRALTVVLIVLSVASTVLLAVFTHVALVGLGLLAAAVALFAVAGRVQVRTVNGKAMLAEVQGFRQYLANTRVDQIRIEEREQVFSWHLPYAVAFGLAEQWTDGFAGIDVAPPAEGARPALYWYMGQRDWDMRSFGHSIGSFTTATAGSIAAPPPSSSASGSTGSSAFSDAGYSGGGAGGGGGSSW